MFPCMQQHVPYINLMKIKSHESFKVMKILSEGL